MAGTMGRFDYISDDGNTYSVRLDASNGAAAGNATSTGGATYPRGWKMRYITVMHPTTGRERRLVIGEVTNALWTAPTGTVSLPDFTTLASVNFVVKGAVGEKRRAV